MCALNAFKSIIQNSRVDVHTDSRALLGLWQNEGGNNSQKNGVIKAILQCRQEFLRLRTRPTLTRVDIQTSIVLSLRKHGPVSRECLDRIPLISCRSTVTAAVISSVIVCRISPHATPLGHPASTCLHNSYLSGKTSMFPPPPPPPHPLPAFVLIGPLLRFLIDQHYQRPFTIIALVPWTPSSGIYALFIIS